MTQRVFHPGRLDVAAFARQGAVLSGTWPQARFTRLATSLVALADTAMVVHWSVRGESLAPAGGAAGVMLHLAAQTSVGLQCQRCLQPMLHALAVERVFRFARDEDEAARLDEEIEDDVLVLARHLDLAQLVEDELILSLPLVPRHDACPQPLLAPDDSAEAAAVHPFAALAALRGSPASR